MGYRKVTYVEQCWYIVKYWLKTIFSRKEKDNENHPSEHRTH